MPVFVRRGERRDHRRGHELRPQVVHRLAQLLGDRFRDRLAERRLAHPLMREQELVVADDLPANPRLLVEARDVVDDELAQGVERRHVTPLCERLCQVA